MLMPYFTHATNTVPCDQKITGKLFKLDDLKGAHLEQLAAISCPHWQIQNEKIKQKNFTEILGKKAASFYIYDKMCVGIVVTTIFYIIRRISLKSCLNPFQKIFDRNCCFG